MPSLSDLLSTPLGESLPRKKGKRRAAKHSRRSTQPYHQPRSPRANLSRLREYTTTMTMGDTRTLIQPIDAASNWIPRRIILHVVSTTCTCCGSNCEATASLPLVEYQSPDRRTSHFSPSANPPTDLPREIQYSEKAIPICHLCYTTQAADSQMESISRQRDWMSSVVPCSWYSNPPEAPLELSEALHLLLTEELS